MAHHDDGEVDCLVEFGEKSLFLLGGLLRPLDPSSYFR